MYIYTKIAHIKILGIRFLLTRISEIYLLLINAKDIK